jgi:hypothetical protein
VRTIQANNLYCTLADINDSARSLAASYNKIIPIPVSFIAMSISDLFLDDDDDGSSTDDAASTMSMDSDYVAELRRTANV